MIGIILVSIAAAFGLPAGADDKQNSFQPSTCAIRVVTERSDGTNKKKTSVGTAFLVEHKDNHYIVTAYHVIARTTHVFLAYDEQFGYADITEFVDSGFGCDPATEVCVFRCTGPGLERLTDPKTYARRAVRLSDQTVAAKTTVDVVGNPALNFFAGTNLAHKRSFLNLVAPLSEVFALSTAGRLLADAVIGDAQTTPVIVIASPFITYGYSGGPVFKAGTERVAGMLVGGDPVSKLYCWAVDAPTIAKVITAPASKLDLKRPAWPDPKFRNEATKIQTLYAVQWEVQQIVETRAMLDLIERYSSLDSPQQAAGLPAEPVRQLSAAIREFEDILRDKANATDADRLFLRLAKATLAFGDGKYKTVIDFLPTEQVNAAYKISQRMGETTQRLKAFAYLRLAEDLAKRDGFADESNKFAEEAVKEFKKLADLVDPGYRFWASQAIAYRVWILARAKRLEDCLKAADDVLEDLRQQDYQDKPGSKIELIQAIVAIKVIAYTNVKQFDKGIEVAQTSYDFLEKNGIQKLPEGDAKQFVIAHQGRLLHMIGQLESKAGRHDRAMENHVKGLKMHVGLVFPGGKTQYNPEFELDLLTGLLRTGASINAVKEDAPMTCRVALATAIAAYEKLMQKHPEVFRDDLHAMCYALRLIDNAVQLVDKNRKKATQQLDEAIRVLQVPPEPSLLCKDLLRATKQMRTLIP